MQTDIKQKVGFFYHRRAVNAKCFNLFEIMMHIPQNTQSFPPRQIADSCSSCAYLCLIIFLICVPAIQPFDLNKKNKNGSIQPSEAPTSQTGSTRLNFPRWHTVRLQHSLQTGRANAWRRFCYFQTLFQQIGSSVLPILVPHLHQLLRRIVRYCFAQKLHLTLTQIKPIDLDFQSQTVAPPRNSSSQITVPVWK